MSNLFDKNNLTNNLFLMPNYDLLTFRKHLNSTKIHLFPSRVNREEKCVTDHYSICGEGIEHQDTESIEQFCKSEESAIKITAKLKLEGHLICGVCVSVLYDGNWKH